MAFLISDLLISEHSCHLITLSALCQHSLRNRQADLLGRFQIYNELKLRGLFASADHPAWHLLKSCAHR